MTEGESLLLISLIILALGLTSISLYIRILPFSLASMIAWIVLAIGFITGDIGPGFDTLWVDAISILFVLLAFTPLVVQSLQDVSHESNYGGTSFKWKTVQDKSWKPESTDPYIKRREEIRALIDKRRKPRSARRDGL